MNEIDSGKWIEKQGSTQSDSLMDIMTERLMSRQAFLNIPNSQNIEKKSKNILRMKLT
jgi:hypothetical protein